MRNRLVIILLIALAVMSCSKVPSDVVKPDRMANLMADIYVGESVIELNRRDYPTDSARQAMKQSVLLRHGITQEQMDSSLAWYGRNITYYMEMTDKTIDILERRLAETGNRIAAENVSVAGDSVDVWGYARFLAINRLSPSRLVTFAFDRDENWEKGDVYTWRAKFSNNAEMSEWAIIAEYSDGTREMYVTDLTGDGWREIRFVCDTTRTATRISGYIDARPRPATTLWVDSIMLLRDRLENESYSPHYRQVRVTPKNKIEAVETDSISE